MHSYIHIYEHKYAVTVSVHTHTQTHTHTHTHTHKHTHTHTRSNICAQIPKYTQTHSLSFTNTHMNVHNRQKKSRMLCFCSQFFSLMKTKGVSFQTKSTGVNFMGLISPKNTGLFLQIDKRHLRCRFCPQKKPTKEKTEKKVLESFQKYSK